MRDESSRRSFLKKVARYGYAAPVIATVLSREARACLSGYPGGETSPTPTYPTGTCSPYHKYSRRHRRHR
ncbi:MAG: hypothetical protein JXP34_14315 [Planctomycetes bacterium]|nr:hypothetical protein [Planctomycetota bacterium]